MAQKYGDIISFYGTDGSGKTSIATAFARLDRHNESLLIGGSSYKQWLTPQIAKNTVGKNHRFDNINSSIQDKIRLYEDLAIACYGLAQYTADHGGNVVIDSDPYFKRIIWESLHLSEDDSRKYIDRFEERMVDCLGSSAAPNHVVGINMQPKSITSQQLLGRLSLRGNNSEHDPTEIDQIHNLDNQVRQIWKEIKRAPTQQSHIPGFNTRLRYTRAIEMENPDREPFSIDKQIQSIAKQIADKLADSNQ